jgi:hypothetical protein
MMGDAALTHPTAHAAISGQVPDLLTRAEEKVFWFFSSEKNTLACT